MKLSRRQLPLNALRAFEAAARHSHLKKAAAELGVTRGAVSQQIRRLEENLARPLFLRVKRRLELTTSGKQLLRAVSQGLDHISIGVEQLDVDMESMSGELLLCSTPSICNNLLMQVIGNFVQQFPEVTLRTQAIGPNQSSLPEDMDISLCFGLPDAGHLPIHKLYETEMFPVASPGLMANRKQPKQAAELVDFPLLHDRADVWPIWFSAFANNESASRLSNTYYQDTYQAIAAARMGGGIALAEYYEVANDLAQGKLVRLTDKQLKLDAGCYLVTRPPAQQTLRSKAFVQAIKDHISALSEYFVYTTPLL